MTLTPASFSPAYRAAQATPDLVSTPLNPLMIALYAAFLGEVLKRLNQEMERSQALATENERARLARDIHDGVSQTLFMLSMSLETGQVLAEKEKANQTSSHLQKLTPIAQKALIELRNAMHNTEPIERGTLSLEKAIDRLVRDYRSATGQNIQFLHDSDVGCSASTASELFRMTQEALSNACLHAGAQTITVNLTHNEIFVQDDGSGFQEHNIKSGRGLENLKHRARDSGIEHKIETNQDGTTVRFRWKESKIDQNYVG